MAGNAFGNIKSDLEYAYESGSEEAINSLSRAELIFLISEALGAESPDDHPSEHSGNVEKDILRSWAFTALRLEVPDELPDDPVSESEEESEEGDGE